MPDRDPLYLFLCHLEWKNRRHLAPYNELVAALDDRDPAIRELAQHLIHRRSPRPTCCEVNNALHPTSRVLGNDTACLGRTSSMEGSQGEGLNLRNHECGRSAVLPLATRSVTVSSGKERVDIFASNVPLMRRVV